MENNDVVVIELDKPRTLKLCHRVLKRFSAHTNLSIMQIEDAVKRYDYAAQMMYEMLHNDDPQLTVEAVDDLLDEVSPVEVMTKVAEAMQAAFGNGEEDDKTDPPKRSRGTGAKA